MWASPTACFSWARKPRESDSVQFQCIRAFRSGWSMLVAMLVHSARPLPIPKCSSKVAATLPAPPAALSPVYTDVVRRESMAVTTLIGNFVGGNLAAAVSARERNDSRAIRRDQAPATIWSLVDSFQYRIDGK
jgi:hypothetical protein